MNDCDRNTTAGDQKTRVPRTRTGRGMAVCATVVAAAMGGIGEAQAVDQIGRYCAASWRNAQIVQQDWADCTQQTFADLLGRVSRTGLPTAIADPDSEERRALNRSIWCTVKRWKRAPVLRALDPGGCADQQQNATVHEPPCTESAELNMTAARLSARQRQILSLWSQGWPIREIANDVGLSPQRTSDEKYKALVKLRRCLSPQVS